VDTTIASGQAELSTWLIEKDSAKGTFILAYGDTGNKSYLLQQAYFFNARGYNVILFDYRGFGGSSAFSYDSTNLYHTEYYEDLKSVYAFAKSYYADHPIYIYAVSMGTIFASRLELRDLDGLVLDKPLLGLEHAVENLKKKGKHLKTPKLPELNNPNRLVIFYGTEDMVCDEQALLQYTKGKEALLYSRKRTHKESIMNEMRDKYFDVIDIGLR
jgi:alpha-beta hydrolase superfamily lysophospholipase